MDERILTNVRNVLEGTFTREDWNVLWHTAPQAARETIAGNGLIAAQGGGHGLAAAPGVPHPSAVYLTAHPGHIGIMDHSPFESEAFATDIWEVNTHGLDLHIDWPAVYEHGASFEEDGSFWFESDELHDLMRMGDEFHPTTIGDPLPWIALTGTCCIHGDIDPARIKQISLDEWMAEYGSPSPIVAS